MSASTRSAIAAASGSWVTMTTARPVRLRSSASTAAPFSRVEVAGRLVGQDELGVVDQRSRDREPLLLAPGELMRKVVGDVRQPELVDQPPRPPLAARPARRAAAPEA